MKLIPCPKCRAYALARAHPPLALAMASLLESSFAFVCARCKKRHIITSAEFVRLPDATISQLRAAGTDLDLTGVEREETFRRTLDAHHTLAHSINADPADARRREPRPDPETAPDTPHQP